MPNSEARTYYNPFDKRQNIQARARTIVRKKLTIPKQSTNSSNNFTRSQTRI